MVSVIKGICLLCIYVLNWNLIERQKTIVNKTALFQNKTLKRRGRTFAPTSNNLLLEIYLRWHIFSQIYFYPFIQKKGHWVLYSYRKFETDLKYAKHDSSSAIASELITDIFCSITAMSWVSPEERPQVTELANIILPQFIILDAIHYCSQFPHPFSTCLMQFNMHL